MSAFESRLILHSISAALRIPLRSYKFGIGFFGGAELNGLYTESEDEEHLQKEIYRDGGGGIDGWEWRKEGNGETERARERGRHGQWDVDRGFFLNAISSSNYVAWKGVVVTVLFKEIEAFYSGEQRVGEIGGRGNKGVKKDRRWMRNDENEEVKGKGKEDKEEDKFGDGMVKGGKVEREECARGGEK
ncbi:hypothetical protein KSS87_001240 [Heliosperma pusillum]|nr:hypothetical protein KSS87_001240 [Heliosperma pusillum]